MCIIYIVHIHEYRICGFLIASVCTVDVILECSSIYTCPVRNLGGTSQTPLFKPVITFDSNRIQFHPNGNASKLGTPPNLMEMVDFGRKKTLRSFY